MAGQVMLGRRVEEALAFDPDDVLATDCFAARAPRSLDGYQRLADTLARTGRTAEAARVIRTGWGEAPADPAAEPGFLERNIALLTPEHHWRRFDRLALAGKRRRPGGWWPISTRCGRASPPPGWPMPPTGRMPMRRPSPPPLWAAPPWATPA